MMSSNPNNITCFILAGGQSKRLGANKALIEIGGERLIDIMLRKLSAVFSELVLITIPEHNYPDIKQKKIFDIVPNKSSLGGVYTGLMESNSSHSFFLACDMPFINMEFIKFMLEKKLDYDLLIPETNKGFQPLHAIYSKSCISHIKKLMDENNFKILDFFDKVRLKCIPEKICREFDPEEKMFLNINTVEDLKIAEKMKL